jgi:hypothetical protein
MALYSLDGRAEFRSRDREVRTADDECLGVVLTASPPVAQRDSFERESEPLASRRFPIHRLARRLLSRIRPQVQRDCQGLDHYRPTVAASKEAADRQVCLGCLSCVKEVSAASANDARSLANGGPRELVSHSRSRESTELGEFAPSSLLGREEVAASV